MPEMARSDSCLNKISEALYFGRERVLMFTIIAIVSLLVGFQPMSGVQEKKEMRYIPNPTNNLIIIGRPRPVLLRSYYELGAMVVFAPPH